MFKEYVFKAVIITLILLVSDIIVYAYTGRIDRSGGHYDWKTGDSNFHNSNLTGFIQLQQTPYRSTTSGATDRSRTTDVAQAIIDAKNDIQDPYGWAIGSFLTASACGCLGGSVVLLVSQIMEPKPPIHRLIGKSPEYVVQYTNTYQREAKNRRLLYTTGGCLGGTIVAVVLWSDLYTEGY